MGENDAFNMWGASKLMQLILAMIVEGGGGAVVVGGVWFG